MNFYTDAAKHVHFLLTSDDEAQTSLGIQLLGGLFEIDFSSAENILINIVRIFPDLKAILSVSAFVAIRNEDVYLLKFSHKDYYIMGWYWYTTYIYRISEEDFYTKLDEYSIAKMQKVIYDLHL